MEGHGYLLYFITCPDIVPVQLQDHYVWWWWISSDWHTVLWFKHHPCFFSTASHSSCVGCTFITCVHVSRCPTYTCPESNYHYRFWFTPHMMAIRHLSESWRSWCNDVLQRLIINTSLFFLFAKCNDVLRRLIINRSLFFLIVQFQDHWFLIISSGVLVFDVTHHLMISFIHLMLLRVSKCPSLPSA